MLATLLSALFSSLFGKLLEWFKQNELEQQAALAQELQQHAASVAAAGAAQEQAEAAVAAHQAAASHVTELQAQLDDLKKWNDKSKFLRIKSRELKRRISS